jgi:hypothetical protein
MYFSLQPLTLTHSLSISILPPSLPIPLAISPLSLSLSYIYHLSPTSLTLPRLPVSLSLPITLSNTPSFSLPPSHYLSSPSLSYIYPSPPHSLSPTLPPFISLPLYPPFLSLPLNLTLSLYPHLGLPVIPSHTRKKSLCSSLFSLPVESKLPSLSLTIPPCSRFLYIPPLPLFLSFSLFHTHYLCLPLSPSHTLFLPLSPPPSFSSSL